MKKNKSFNNINLTVISCLISILLFSGAAASLPLGGNSNATQSYAFYCDSDVETVEYCPGHIAAGQHGDLAALLVQPVENVNTECEMNPNDPSCGTPMGTSFFGDVRIIVIYPKTSYIEVKNVALSGFDGMYSQTVTNVAPNTSELELLDKMVEIEQTVAQHKSESVYEFNSVNGTYENFLGVPISDLSTGSGSWSGNDFPLGCAGVTDLATTNNLISVADGDLQGSCLTNIRSAILNKIDAPTGLLRKLLRAVNDVNALGTYAPPLSAEGIVNNGGITVKFPDDSIGFFDIKLNSDDSLNITPNEERSALANGMTLAEFKALAEDTSDPFARTFEFNDLVNFMALTGFGQHCTYDITGYRNVVEYTVKRHPDGTATITIVSLTSTAVYITNCSSVVGVNPLAP